jgi:DNA-binding NtrC family response regulator
MENVALVLVVGPDEALLEGVSQILTAAGYRTLVAADVPQGIESLGPDRPLMAVVHRDELMRNAAGLRIPLAPGGALLSFQTDDTVEPQLPFALKRATLAELRLPLERQRLLALLRHVETRAQATRGESEASDYGTELNSDN